MNADTLHTMRLDFTGEKGPMTLAERDAAFRGALLRFEPRPAVLLLREGFHPLPLAEASNDDVMFAQAIQITGKRRTARIIVNRT